MSDQGLIVIGNSFCQLKGFSAKILSIIKKRLTYENEEADQQIQQCFRLMKVGKRKGNYRMVFAMKKKLEELEKSRTVCWLDDKGRFPTGHIMYVVEELERKNAKFQVQDARIKPSHFHTFRWRNPPPEMRYYQKEIFDAAVEQERGVFEAAVGSGKTLVIANIIKHFSVTSLVIVPSAALLEQFYRTMRLYFGSSLVVKVTTAEVKSGKKLAPIRVATIQTLASLYKKGGLGKVVKDVDLFVVDEFHHSGSRSYTELLSSLDGVFYRFGCTGTFMRNDSKTLDMLGVLSNRIYRYPPAKAIADGFLTPVEFRIRKIKGRPGQDYQREYNQHFCAKKDLMDATWKCLQQIPKNQQVLILVDRKEKSGNILHKFLTEAGYENTYLTGDCDKRDIADAISAFNDEKIRIMIGSTVIGEGIDLRAAQHLILLTGGKSPIKIIQAIGRCVRLHDGKAKSYVYDFCFTNTKWLEKHCSARVKLYKSEFAGEIVWED